MSIMLLMDLGSGRNLCTSHNLSNPSSKRFENCPVRGTSLTRKRRHFIGASVICRRPCFIAPLYPSNSRLWRYYIQKRRDSCTPFSHVTDGFGGFLDKNGQRRDSGALSITSLNKNEIKDYKGIDQNTGNVK